MTLLRTVFMGSPPFAATLLDHLCKNGFTPLLVITQKPKPSGRGREMQPTAVQVKADKLGIKTVATGDANGPSIIQTIRAIHPDIIMVAAFGQIFKSELLALPHFFCLNVHASLLPQYRGAAPIQWAVWNGERKTGITIQRMTPRLDAGDILMQRSVEITSDDTSETLLSKLADTGAGCLLDALRLCQKNQAKFTPQDESKASLAPKILKEHAAIDWNDGSDHIHNQIRALQPWPVSIAQLGRTRLKIFASTVREKHAGTPGEIITDSKTYLSVICGDKHLLSLTELQLENRKRLSIREFLSAYRGIFPFQRMEPL